MRLVPGMTPAKAFALYKSYVEKIAPAGVDVEVRLIHSGDPMPDSASTTPTSRPPRAPCTRFGARTRSLSAPAAPFPSSETSTVTWALPSVMMGFGLPDDNIHAPNEKFHLKNFELGIVSLIRFLEEVGL